MVAQKKAEAKNTQKTNERTPQQQAVKDVKDAIAKQKQEDEKAGIQRTPEQMKAKQEKNKLMAQMAAEKASKKKDLTPEQQAIKDEKMARIAERRA